MTFRFNTSFSTKLSLKIFISFILLILIIKVNAQSPRVFNVIAYGADTSFTIDATSAIQRAIDAAFAAGGGVVFFPNGHYKIAGALQTNVQGVNPNSTLYSSIEE